MIADRCRAVWAGGIHLSFTGLFVTIEQVRP